LVATDGYVPETQTGRIRPQCALRDSRARHWNGQGWIGRGRSDGDVATRTRSGRRSEFDAEGGALAGREGQRSCDAAQTETGPADGGLRNRDARTARIGDRFVSVRRRPSGQGCEERRL